MLPVLFLILFHVKSLYSNELDASRMPDHISIAVGEIGSPLEEYANKIMELIQSTRSLGVTTVSFVLPSPGCRTTISAEDRATLMGMIASHRHVFLENSIQLKWIGEPGECNVCIAHPHSTVVIALNFNIQQHLARSIVALLNIYDQSQMTEQLMSSYLDLDIEGADLYLLTGGEKRLSNIYQMVDSEYYFTPRNFLEFSEEDLIEALLNYQTRERRFRSSYSRLQNNRKFSTMSP
jgi:undecaprenyl pyrophosphate synthase